MLKKRIRPRMGVKESTVIRSPGHLAYVRKHHCACFSTHYDECWGAIEAAHVRIGTDGGSGMKPSDCWTVPLCSWHHQRQHATGERTFETEYRIDMKKIAEELWLKSPARVKLSKS